MKNFLAAASIIFALLCSEYAFSQANVLDPNDPDVVFTSSNQPAAPAYNQISKWGHTNRLGWNPYSYGYKSYIFKGMAFRIKFPKTYAHNVADGKTYPGIIFLHGLGEPGNIWDNELHLVHGGQKHAQDINDGVFDGFMIYPQSANGYLQSYFPIIKDLTDSLTKYVKLDIDRINVGGLSSGGQAAWDFLQNQNYAKMTSSLSPISAAQYEDVNYFASHITIPIFVANGGMDVAPYPSTVTDIINAYKNLGGSIMQAFFPEQGHGAWNAYWNDSRYWPFVKACHKANPLIYFQRDAFCPSETVNAKLGLQAGFAAYEWQKDGVTIAGQVSKDLTVTSYGTYRARFKRTSTGNWSEWSPSPAVISLKTATVTPPIAINGLFSNILPAPNSQTTTPLFIPANFAAYEWRRVSDNVLVSSANTYNAPIGEYKVKVTEQYGCSSSFSDSYKVISAAGNPKPDAASNLNAYALSNTSVQVEWDNNPAPINNETAFEVYRSTTAGNNYSLVGNVAADVTSFTDHNLLANTRYYYIVRAINLTGAAPVTSEVNVLTQSDTEAPTVPANLSVTGTTRTSVSLSWDESTDDVGVNKYDIYVNGIKSYTTTGLTFTINGLTPLTSYAFYVVAKDLSGNTSAPSNQVTALAALRGLNYKYYEGSWTVLPNFNTLVPVKTGVTPNVDITVRLRNDNFGFLWEGFINIPTTGSYTFETNSDDGSKLYIGPYDFSTTALVNNDGLHGNQISTGTITLTAGAHPIAMVFFEAGGGETMQVYWSSSAAGISRQLIPNSAFTDAATIPPSSFANMPTDLNVNALAYNKINISWTDNSNNESGFEVVRSNSQYGTYEAVGNAAANTTNFIDSVTVAASTKYWYKVRAVNSFGESNYFTAAAAQWNFDNNGNDASGNNKNLTEGNSPTYNTADKVEGTHAIVLNGTNQYLNMDFGGNGIFPNDAYSERTMALWIKPGAINLANKIIVDLGGADNGIALRLNSNTLQAGIASNNVRAIAQVSTLATDANWVSAGWNHVAVVYLNNSLKLYLNGVLKITQNLTFSSVGTTTNASRIGSANGTNAFNSTATSSFYAGAIDNMNIYPVALNAVAVMALKNMSFPADTSLALPGVPTAPQIASATALSSNTIQLVINDLSNNETEFQLYRSVSDNSNYRLLTTLSANASGTFNYLDAGLFANTNYYYKIKAKGVGGISAFSNEKVEKTNNNKPVINQVNNFSMRYDGQKVLQILATDADVENLTFSFTDASKPLPVFANFTNTGNGAGNISFVPSFAQQGTYPIAVMVQDQNGGKDTMEFVLTVNENYPPVIAPISNVSMQEGSTNNLFISATDQNGNGSLTWSITSGPSFISFIPFGNGMGLLNIQPGFSDGGVYQVVLTVNDGNGGTETTTFSLTVNEVAPPAERIYMSMKYTNNSPAPWNTISTTTTNNLLNSNGQQTPVGLQFLSTPWNAGNAGAQTGNNSGVYPDIVLKDYFWFGIYGAPETVSFNIRNLVTSSQYDVTIMGTSAWTGAGNNGTTIYTINGVDKPLYVHNNTQNTVSFNGIAPDAGGNIKVSMRKGAATPYGLITAIVLDKQFNDGSTPQLPLQFTGEALTNGSVKLHWKDVAYNESSYLVYRSNNAAGPFTILNPAATNKNDSTYIDATVASSTTYYYKIEAVNINGTSGFTNVVSVTTLNKAPILTALNAVSVKAGETGIVNIVATDDAGDVLTIQVNNLPSFASYQNIGNGTGKITINPLIEHIGIYSNIQVVVTDNGGATNTKYFDLTVTDPQLRNVYVNFAPDAATAEPAPWNNFKGYLFANNIYGNLKDDAGAQSGFNFKFLSQWTGALNVGMLTGNNSGVFPDNVQQGSLYMGTTGNHTIEFGGLNPAKMYSIGFLTNFNIGSASVVTFTIGTQVVTVDGKYNTNSLANLNGLTPNSSGKIQVVINKSASVQYLNLNGLVIREYDPAIAIVRPADLIVETVRATDKVKLYWSDRSNNESGFEIWKATSANGTYTLAQTTVANTNNTTVTGLNENTRYYFRVRSIKSGANSGYSNTATAVVAKSVVLLNFNVTPPQNEPAPWNNTSGPSIVGATFNNLQNISNVNSGFGMEITKEFNGKGFDGPAVAGILPANVMVSNYWTDAGQTSQVKFTNLDLSKKYRLSIFSSNLTVAYTTATYTANGKSVMVNTFNNNSKIVSLDLLVPNENGEIFVDARTYAGSPYSFTNAMILEYFDDNLAEQPLINTIYPSVPGNDAPNKLHVLPGLNTEAMAKNTKASVNEIERDETNISVVPNPFVDKINISFFQNKAANVTVEIYDINGRAIYKQSGLKAIAGNNNISIQLNNKLISPGKYFLSVLIDGKKQTATKLIKVN